MAMLARFLTTAAVVVAMLALVACGGGSGETGQTTGTVSVSASPASLEFDGGDVVVDASVDTVTVTKPDGTTEAITLTGSGSSFSTTYTITGNADNTGTRATWTFSAVDGDASATDTVRVDAMELPPDPPDAP